MALDIMYISLGYAIETFHVFELPEPYTFQESFVERPEIYKLQR